MKTGKLILLILVLISLLACKKTTQTISIRYYEGADLQIELAAKEIQRYIYLRTGILADINSLKEENAELKKNVILLATSQQYKKNVAEFKTEQDYYLASQPEQGLLILGASPIGVLYGAYQFVESGLGVSFELQGDIIPDEKLKEITLTGFDEGFSPSFSLRGIQPFHDFPEGPDYWTEEDYQAVITQLPKMRMNFIGFHTYPESEPHSGWNRAEPNVWIGTKDEFNPNGTVNTAYPVLHANTGTCSWDYYPVRTSDYSFGASQLFDTDVFGTDFMKNKSEWPHSDAENIEIVNSMGKILNHSFTWAKDLGVKTCIGTEVPLLIPQQVKKRLQAKGKNPDAPEVKKEIYTGLFSRIMATHPLDYYWFWTPEGWTWQGENNDELKQTETDLLIAMQSAHEVNVPFQLATCGWVLGPKHDRLAFDKLLPKSWPFSCINRQQGFTPVESGFKDLKGRPKWEISWIEDDPGLTIPQLWAGRVRKDALDAYKYGCDGLMGIHWRTMVLSPAFKALTDAGWNTDSYNIPVASEDRDYPVDDLYYDWADKWFGQEAGKLIAELFIKYDGGFYPNPHINTQTEGNLPRPADWVNQGPGGVLTNLEPWEEVSKNYAFVDEFASYAPLIKGEGCKFRFDYWLNTFRYLRQMGETGCLFGEMEKTLEEGKSQTSHDKQIIAEKALLIREKLIESWGKMVTYQLQTVNTKGEMGTIANLEQLNLERNQMLNRYNDQIAQFAKKEISPAILSKKYTGDARLVVTTKQSLLRKGEHLRLQAAVLCDQPIQTVVVYYKKFGDDTYQTVELKNINAHVYEGQLPYVASSGDPVEYYYEARLDTEKLIYPASSPNCNLTIIYW